MGRVKAPASAVGPRIHGNRSKAGRRTGLGKEYLLVAVDDATRVAFAELHPRQDGAHGAPFRRHARAWYAALGIEIPGVMTDNAKAYQSQGVRAVFAVFAERPIRHLRTKPYHPQTTGTAARFIQTALRRWAFKRPYRTSRLRSAALPAFLDSYNVERPHRALGRLPPPSTAFHRVPPRSTAFHRSSISSCGVNNVRRTHT